VQARVRPITPSHAQGLRGWLQHWVQESDCASRATRSLSNRRALLTADTGTALSRCWCYRCRDLCKCRKAKTSRTVKTSDLSENPSRTLALPELIHEHKHWRATSFDTRVHLPDTRNDRPDARERKSHNGASPQNSGDQAEDGQRNRKKLTRTINNAARHIRHNTHQLDTRRHNKGL